MLIMENILTQNLDCVKELLRQQIKHNKNNLTNRDLHELLEKVYFRNFQHRHRILSFCN